VITRREGKGWRSWRICIRIYIKRKGGKWAEGHCPFLKGAQRLEIGNKSSLPIGRRKEVRSAGAKKSEIKIKNAACQLSSVHTSINNP
jgi:hypothetical protein